LPRLWPLLLTVWALSEAIKRIEDEPSATYADWGGHKWGDTRGVVSVVSAFLELALLGALARRTQVE
jgi:hypothetical protein